MKSRYKKFTLCTKLYFYLKCLENTLLQTTSDFVLHYVKNHKLYFPYHRLYTNIQNVNILPLFLHHCKCPFLSMQLDARLGLTKLRFLWSWCLPQFLHKKFTNFTFHIIICTQISKYPNGCYLHMIIMHRTVIASIIKAITVLCM